MANVLAQSNPASSTLTDIVTLSGGDSVSKIYICNQDTVAALVRLAFSLGGGTIAARDYLLYDAQLGPGRTLMLDFGLAGLKLGNGSIIRGRADSASVSFNVLGA